MGTGELAVDDVSTALQIDGGILVGHDGSEHADAALRWAARLATQADMPLHVLRTWVISTAPRPSTWSPGYAPPVSDFEAAVRADLVADVRRCGLPEDGVQPQLHVVHGTPGRRLVEATESADILVVSKRGRGGFMGLVLGSTTDQVVRHAKCPVVVVPVSGEDRQPADPDRVLPAG
jgi:nucleotide-binding universal stress UspA family protein